MRSFVVAALMLSVSTAKAETVTVRTGEHDGFTRIVLHAQTDQEWSVSGDPGELSVISKSGALFDSNSAFDRIQRDRVAEFSDSGTGTLTAKLNCDCDHRVFPWRRYGLVIDVLDGPALSKVDSGSAAEIDISGPELDVPGVPAVEQRPVLQAADALAIAEIERQIAGALVSPISSGVTALPFHASHVSQDLGVTLDSLSPPRTCQVLSDPKGWATGHGFVDGLRILRQLEPDSVRYTTDQAVMIARHYLHYGFASEARTVLEAANRLGPDGAVLIDLSRILENPGHMSGQDLALMQCGSAALIWQFLSDDSLGAYAESDIRDIAAQALDLPDGLFSSVHESLIARLQPVSPEAAAVVRAHARTKGADAAQARATDQHALVQAVLMTDAGGPSLSQDVLESLWFQFRGTEQGAGFAQAMANDLLSARAFVELEKVLQAPHFPPDLRRDLQERTLIVIAAEASDDVFLKAAFKQAPDDHAGRVRRLVAERLSLMGFVDTAQTWLGHQRAETPAPPALRPSPPLVEQKRPGRITAARQVLDDGESALADLRDALKVLE